MHIKVLINVVSADVNVVSKYVKTTDEGPSSPDSQLGYLFGHFYMFGKDIGTMMHLKQELSDDSIARLNCVLQI